MVACAQYCEAPVPVSVLTVLQRSLLQFLNTVFVISFSGVIKYHGVRPKREANQVSSTS